MGYAPGDEECTGSFTSIEALLDEIGSGAYSGDGTIYFTTDYSTNDAYIRGSDARLALLQALTVDGQGHTLSVPLEITGWAYDVTVANLNLVGAAGALRIETTGAITVSDVPISESGGDGAYLDNAAGASSITVTDSAFTDNTWTGLDARSHGDITLTHVIATGQEDGAYLDASTGSGSITITDSDFSNNTLAGLTAKTSSGGLSLHGVSADHNTLIVAPMVLAMAGPSTIAPGEAYGLGLTASAGGSITVDGGSARQNEGKGLWIEGTGPIVLSGVTASDNGLHGAYISNPDRCAALPIEVTVAGGAYETNGGYGVLAVLGPKGVFTLTGSPAFSGNALGDYAANLDPCPTCEEKEESKLYNTVYVPETGSLPIPLDCTAYAGTILIFPDGDRATLTCPVSGEATASTVGMGSLPGPLPAGRSFVRGASIELTRDGLPVATITEGGFLTVAFLIPEELKAASLAIVFWDALASRWVELPAYAARPDGTPLLHRLHPDAEPGDGMFILGGVRVMQGIVKVKVTFGGTFVLVSR